jgi:hypothetical protein
MPSVLVAWLPLTVTIGGRESLRSEAGRRRGDGNGSDVLKTPVRCPQTNRRNIVDRVTSDGPSIRVSRQPAISLCRSKVFENGSGCESGLDEPPAGLSDAQATDGRHRRSASVHSRESGCVWWRLPAPSRTAFDATRGLHQIAWCERASVCVTRRGTFRMDSNALIVGFRREACE